MNKKVTVDNLAKEIEKSLNDFVGVTEEACEKGVIETSEDAVKALRAANPAGSGEYSKWSKAYNKGWTFRKEKKKGAKGILSTVWNEKHYRLTHLLEKGHAKVNGGRTRAFPHIAPVEKQCEDELVTNIRKNIE
ncbi:MAG: hypothetical protein IKU40_08760 [Clostridia bacterium]|nr:hypothetical protein [Clostridia bacterium]